MRKWATLREPARFEAWFQRIVVNTCRDRLRRGARRPTRDLDQAPAVVAADAYAGVHERDRMSWAFARLEPDHRIVLVLRYYRDMQVDEIARLLGVRPGTVKSRLSRAQERMRMILGDHETERWTPRSVAGHSAGSRKIKGTILGLPVLIPSRGA